jgi:hypothetical protein
MFSPNGSGMAGTASNPSIGWSSELFWFVSVFTVLGLVYVGARSFLTRFDELFGHPLCDSGGVRGRQAENDVRETGVDRLGDARAQLGRRAIARSTYLPASYDQPAGTQAAMREFTAAVKQSAGATSASGTADERRTPWAERLLMSYGNHRSSRPSPATPRWSPHSSKLPADATVDRCCEKCGLISDVAAGRSFGLGNSYAPEAYTRSGTYAGCPAGRFVLQRSGKGQKSPTP